MKSFSQLSANRLNVADVVAATEAEGPGKRFAIWLQGCPLRCPGCCNPQMLSFSGGRMLTVDELLAEIRIARQEHGIEGITLLGGEPTAQAAAASELAEGVRQLGLSVMLFSGYTLDELHEKADPALSRLLKATDILVDGPYLQGLPETKRRWIGSRNQVVHFLTARYRADDPCWNMPNSLEIRFDGRELTVNGFPAPAAQSLWRRVRTIGRAVDLVAGEEQHAPSESCSSASTERR